MCSRPILLSLAHVALRTWLVWSHVITCVFGTSFLCDVFHLLSFQEGFGGAATKLRVALTVRDHKIIIPFKGPLVQGDHP